MQVVTEAVLYQLIFRFRKPDAKKFKRWVTHEVLPSIRKTGSYSTQSTLPDFADPAAAARAWADQYEAKVKAPVQAGQRRAESACRGARKGLEFISAEFTAFPGFPGCAMPIACWEGCERCGVIYGQPPVCYGTGGFLLPRGAGDGSFIVPDPHGDQPHTGKVRVAMATDASLKPYKEIYPPRGFAFG